MTIIQKIFSDAWRIILTWGLKPPKSSFKIIWPLLVVWPGDFQSFSLKNNISSIEIEVRGGPFPKEECLLTFSCPSRQQDDEEELHSTEPTRQLRSTEPNGIEPGI